MVSLSLRGLTVSHATARRRRTTALEGVSLDIPDGALAVVTGPAGSGKSTLLRAIAGLDRLDAGAVAFSGADVTTIPTRQRRVAYLPHPPPALPPRTVRGQIAEALRYAELEPSEVTLRVEAVAQTLGFAALLDRPPGALAAGDRQRVALARVLVRRPDVLLLDEPFADLAPAQRARVRSEALRLRSTLAITTLWATADPADALPFADLLIVLDAGRLVQAGAAAEVREAPATSDVALLLDPVLRIIDVGVHRDGIVLGDSRVALGSGQRQALGSRSDAVLGVPAHALVPDGPTASGVALAGIVRGRELAGGAHDVAVAVELGPGHRTDLVARPEPQRPLIAGEPVALRLDVGACLLFDREGRSLHHGRRSAAGDS